MSQTLHIRRSLTRQQQQALATLLERQGDVALSQQLSLARQTLARAVAGFPLNSVSRSVLEEHLGTGVAAA